MSGRTLTQDELDALPLGARVGYTDARGCPGAAVKVGTRQSSEVVGHSRHNAPRDIPSSGGGPGTTPALARAIEAYRAHRMLVADDGVSCETCGCRPPLVGNSFRYDADAWMRHRMHATVSAALHDPDEPAWLHRAVATAIRDFHAGPASQPLVACVVDAVRAAILGARGEVSTS